MTCLQAKRAKRAMAKAKAKSKPCAKAKCKGKGRGKGKGLGTRTSLQGLARRQAVVRKRKAQVLEEIPGPTVEQDPLVAELKLELESQLLDIHVDEAGEADPAPSAEPSVDAAPSQHAVLEQSASLPPAGVVEELSEACAPESEQHGAARPLFARADGDAEEPSAVAQRATAVQAQPSIEILPDWKQALAHVHRWAWTEWQAARPERQFPANCQPGVIPEAYLERLAPIIDALPRPTKYAK